MGWGTPVAAVRKENSPCRRKFRSKPLGQSFMAIMKIRSKCWARMKSKKVVAAPWR
jgi:hypothetical protein